MKRIAFALAAVAERELLKFGRQTGRLVSALVRPLVWLFIFAAGFRSVLGVRADWFHFDVRDDLGLNSGERSDAIVSPKLSLIAGPWDGTEVYAQAGLGYHSNDARGVNARLNTS